MLDLLTGVIGDLVDRTRVDRKELAFPFASRKILQSSGDGGGYIHEVDAVGAVHVPFLPHEVAEFRRVMARYMPTGSETTGGHEDVDRRQTINWKEVSLSFRGRSADDCKRYYEQMTMQSSSTKRKQDAGCMDLWICSKISGMFANWVSSMDRCMDRWMDG